MLKQFHYRMSIILNGTHFLFFSNCAKFSMFLLKKKQVCRNRATFNNSDADVELSVNISNKIHLQ